MRHVSHLFSLVRHVFQLRETCLSLVRPYVSPFSAWRDMCLTFFNCWLKHCLGISFSFSPISSQWLFCVFSCSRIPVVYVVNVMALHTNPGPSTSTLWKSFYLSLLPLFFSMHSLLLVFVAAPPMQLACYQIYLNPGAPRGRGC